MTVTIRNCTFAFRCDRLWQNLKKTKNPDVRFCGVCQEDVFFCHTDSDLVEAITLNRCIAINVPDEDDCPPLMGRPAGY